MAIVFDDEQPAAPRKIVFDDEQQAPQPERGFMGNAVQDVKDLGSGLFRMAKGIGDLPLDAVSTTKQMFQGTPFNKTPIGQDYQNIVQAVPHLSYEPQNPQGQDQFPVRINPGSIAQQFGDIATAPLKAVPDRYMPDFILTPEQSKALPNPFYEHPVNTAMALAPAVKPLFGAARAIPAVEEGINAVGESFQGAAQGFGRRGLGFSKKFINKDPAELARANQAAQTALDTGIIKNPITHPFSSGADDMMARAETLDTQTGQKIGSFLEKQGKKFDWGKAMNDLEQLKRRFPADRSVINQINNVKETIRTTAIRNGGEIPFDQANKLKSYIQNKIPWNSDKAAAQVGQQSAGVFRGSIDNQLEDIAKRGGTSPEFKDFKQNKKMFGDLQTIQKGLLNKRAADSGNMKISLPSVAIGTGEMIHGGWLKGLVAGLGAEWVKKYGSLTAAKMSDNVAKLLTSNPAKYKPLAQSWITKGGSALPAIEQQLRQDPDFSQVINIPTKSKGMFKKAG